MKPDAVVVLTDGYIAGSVPEPAYPVAWVLTQGGQKPWPWGVEVAHIDQ
jgi:predicted metal-dependent peptidase